MSKDNSLLTSHALLNTGLEFIEIVKFFESFWYKFNFLSANFTEKNLYVKTISVKNIFMDLVNIFSKNFEWVDPMTKITSDNILFIKENVKDLIAIDKYYLNFKLILRKIEGDSSIRNIFGETEISIISKFIKEYESIMLTFNSLEEQEQVFYIMSLAYRERYSFLKFLSKIELWKIQKIITNYIFDYYDAITSAQALLNNKEYVEVYNKTLQYIPEPNLQEVLTKLYLKENWQLI